MSQSKRKHKTLTLFQKNVILKRLDKGDHLTNLANEYGVGRATIHDIRKNRDKIKSFCENNDNVKSVRKTLKKGEFPQVEDSLYAWFIQERNRHTPITGEILKEKAKIFYERIMGNDDFKASEGWLEKFKKRFGIRLLSMTGEKLSCDVAAVDPYKEKFKEIINELELTPDQIYNADESGLFYRLLPKKTFVHRAEASAPGRKLAKDRITFMPCANASGEHKLKLLVIGTAKNPRAFKNVNLPVDYKNAGKGWMTQTVFKEWFDGIFVPSVKKFLKKKKLPQKALLILDNCPGHPPEDELKSKGFRVLFLPPNVTPLLQPMDQNVIQTVKMHYKKALLYKVLSKECSVIQSLKETNLKDVVFDLANAWENLPEKTIVCLWRNLCPDLALLEQYKKKKSNEMGNDLNDDIEMPLAVDTNVDENVDRELIELQDTISEKLVEGNESLTAEDVNMWLIGEEEENGQIMTDEEIVEEITRGDAGEDCDEREEASSFHHTVSNDAAMDAFATSVKWAEENNVSASEILVLKRLQEKVLKVSFQAKKQKKIDSFVTPME